METTLNIEEEHEVAWRNFQAGIIQQTPKCKPRKTVRNTTWRRERRKLWKNKFGFRNREPAVGERGGQRLFYILLQPIWLPEWSPRDLSAISCTLLIQNNHLHCISWSPTALFPSLFYWNPIKRKMLCSWVWFFVLYLVTTATCDFKRNSRLSWNLEAHHLFKNA